MSDRLLQATLRVQTAQWESGMRTASAAVEKFSNDSRAMGRFVGQTFRELATPTERLEQQMRKVDVVLAKGRITAEEHARAMGRLTVEYNRASDAASRLAMAEQNARFLGRFNEGRASLAAGESRADLMARMSGGGALGGGLAGGGGMGGAAGAGSLADDAIALAATAKLAKLGGLGGFAKGLGAYGKFGAIGVGALALNKAGQRIDEVDAGASSFWLSRQDADAAKAVKGFLGDAWDNAGDLIASAIGRPLDRLTGGALSEGPRLQRELDEHNKRIEEQNAARAQARAPLEAFELQQKINALVKDRSAESVKQLADQHNANGAIAEANLLYTEYVRLTKEAAANEADRASAAAKHRDKIADILNERAREGRIRENIEAGDTPTQAMLREMGASESAMLMARGEDIREQQSKERKAKSARDELEAQRQLTREHEAQLRLTMERDRELQKIVDRTRSFADAAIARNATPEERFADEQRRIRSAVAAGFLDDVQARRAFDAAARDLTASGGSLAARPLPAPFERGSAAAISLINQQSVQQKTDKKFDDLIATERKALTEAKKTNDLLNEIVDETTAAVIDFF